MASKTVPILDFNFKHLFIFLFFLSFIITVKTLSFTSPTAFTLNDGRIFVIHSLGIDICDSKYTTTERKLTFSSELNEDGISTIAISKFSNGEFILFIINKFYIIDINGSITITSQELTSTSGGEYFTLTAHKISKINGKNLYYFLFGFVNINDLSNFIPKIYYLSLDSSTLSTISSYTINKSIRYNGFSCEFLLKGSSEYIMCIYESYKLVQDYYGDYIKDEYFTISNFPLVNGIIGEIDSISYHISGIEYSQSTIKSEDSKAFFCGLTIQGKSFCFIFDINDFYNKDEYGNTYIYRDTDNEKKCVVKPYNIKTYYFPETGEYVFSCLTLDGGIQTTIYDKNMAVISDIENPSMRLQKEFSNCNGFDYSIIYSQYYQKYYVISDIDCEPYKQFIPLIEEEIEEEEESKEEEMVIKEEEKFIEEEKLEEKYLEEEIIKEEEFLIYEKEKELNEILKEEEFIEDEKEKELKNLIEKEFFEDEKEI